jgi:outer membrane protein TolC
LLSSSALAAEPEAPLVPPISGGLTAAEAGRLARERSPARALDQGSTREARARLREARALYLPRIQLSARYVRLSDFDPPAIGGGGSLVGTLAPAGTVNPTTVSLGSLSFPNILNQYSTSLSVAIPLSDYFLRIRPANEAAALGVEAAALGARASGAGSELAGRLAFFRWSRALGAEAAARESERDARIHLADASNLEAAGMASRADVLRAQAGVAAAEAGVAQASSFVALTSRELRVRLRLPEDAPLQPEALDAGEEDAAEVPDHAALVAEATASRPELRALEASQGRLRAAARAAGGAALPSLAIFGEALYANPNPRYQPQADVWLGTWAAGVSLSWAVQEAFAARPAVEVLEAQLAQVEARSAELRDGIAMEVEDARQAILRSEASLKAGLKELEASREALRVSRDLFRVGRATTTLLTDAEAGLARARLAVLDARVERRAAWARLRHALGRDAR